jgi:inner membrane protein
MSNSNLEKAQNFLRNSVTLKLIMIAILMILLLIPQVMIEEIIHERQVLSSIAIQEVSNKWANSQHINGPILTIPMVYTIPSKEEDKETQTETRYLRVLPKTLNINGNIMPRELERGIYNAIVYQSDLTMSGTIALPIINKENLIEVKYDDAEITLGISDLRGIKEDLKFNWGEYELSVQSGSSITSMESGVTIPLHNSHFENDSLKSFSMELKLQGSKRMAFSPTGEITTVKIESSWADPSFDGFFLPDTRQVSADGFTAEWKILELNRNYPSYWYGNTYFNRIQESTFGITLFLGTGDYQKAIRSAKYGVMIITLTFLIFFLTEVLYRRNIHPFQYTLIGLALCLFFILLVAFTEHMTYGVAYTLGAIAIILMISLYSLSVFKSYKMTVILALLLSIVYIFLYVTLQSADYALLIESIGLTAILGATMYFTRNIDWYKSHSPT